MVDLVLLHGPPASGKLTIAKELSNLVGARVFHNHLTLDVAKSLLTFGDPEFWDLVRDLRQLSLQSYFENGAGIAVTTWCYEEPEDYQLFLNMKLIATEGGGRILPVFLNCDISHLESRVENTHRREMDKLCDLDQLRKILSKKNYTAVPDEMCIELNSGTNSAQCNAREIVRQFKL